MCSDECLVVVGIADTAKTAANISLCSCCWRCCLSMYCTCECVTLHEMFTFNKNQSQKVDTTKLELISLNTEQFNICMWWAKSATVKQIRCKYSNTHTHTHLVGIRKVANKLKCARCITKFRSNSICSNLNLPIQ